MPVVLDCRQQHFAATVANACSGKLKELHQNPSPGAPICRIVKEDHDHGRTTEGMMWPALGEESEVRTIILDDTTAAKRTVQCWERVKDGKIGAGVWVWWTDGLPSDNGRVEAAVVFNHGNQWWTHRSLLGTGRMEVFNAELWGIGLRHGETIEKRETL